MGAAYTPVIGRTIAPSPRLARNAWAWFLGRHGRMPTGPFRFNPLKSISFAELRPGQGAGQAARGAPALRKTWPALARAPVLGLQRFKRIDHGLDDLEPPLPELAPGGVEAEAGEQLGIRFRAAGGEQPQIHLATTVGPLTIARQQQRRPPDWTPDLQQ